jgi:hypothetical protein
MHSLWKISTFEGVGPMRAVSWPLISLPLTLACVAFVLLAGCSIGPRVSFSDLQQYHTSFANYGAQSGKMKLFVIGNPTQDSAQAVSAVAADALKGTHPQAGTVFVPEPATAPKGYRTVIYFGQSDANSICSLTGTAEPRKASAAASSQASEEPVSAGYCLDERMFSYAQGYMPHPADAQDPNLSAMVRDLGLAIFPPAEFPGLPGCRNPFSC